METQTYPFGPFANVEVFTSNCATNEMGAILVPHTKP